MLLECNCIKSGEEFQERQNHIVKMFYQDINIGFITSTGAIKSTSFIFVNREFTKYLHLQKRVIQYPEIMLKITLNIFNPEEMPFIGEKITKPSIKKSFIKPQKFQSQFLVLEQVPKADLKPDVSIYFVYNIVDDQIYAIKRVRPPMPYCPE